MSAALKTWILSLSAAFAIALNGTMVMPAIVLTLSRLPGYDEALATAVASAELAGIAVYGLLLAKWGTTSRRPILIPALLAVLAGQLASLFLTMPAALASARFLAGLGEGAIFGLVTMRIASAPDAERIWGAINLIGGVAMGLLLFVVSALPAEAAYRAVFLCIAIFVVLMLPLLPALTRGKPASTQTQDARPMAPLRLALTLAMVLLIYAVQAGQWAICGFIGQLSHLPPADVGFYLALSSVLGFAGAAVPALTRRKSLRLPAIATGLLLMAFSLHVFFNHFGALYFVGAQVALNIGFYIVTPFLTGLLTEHDRDGSLMSRALVIALVGAAAGTALAGLLLSSLGPGGFSMVFVALTLVTGLIGLIIFVPLHPRTAHGRSEEAS